MNRTIWLACGIAGGLLTASSRGGDARIYLDSTNGASAFVVYDKSTNTLSRVASDGRVIAGGRLNAAGGALAAVGGGYGNVASGAGSVVGGGGGYDGIASNSVGNSALGTYSTVGGGIRNLVASNGWYGTVGGGYGNGSTNGSATVGGGFYNLAGGVASTVGGGYYNGASGSYATVPGGAGNFAAGSYALAAGRGALAAYAGSFVWGDSTAAFVSATAANQFIARASGGVTFFSDAGATLGVRLPANGSGWAGVSDRNLKENFQPVDTAATLERVAALPLSTWKLKAQDPGVRHVGPMAQDFHAAFGVGEDDTHIGYGDADGVALAAIQGLYARLRGLEAENRDLRQRLEALERGRAQPAAANLAEKENGP